MGLKILQTSCQKPLGRMNLSLCYKRQSVTTCLIFCPEPRKIAGVLRLVGYFLKWRVKALFLWPRNNWIWKERHNFRFAHKVCYPQCQLERMSLQCKDSFHPDAGLFTTTRCYEYQVSSKRKYFVNCNPPLQVWRIILHTTIHGDASLVKS